MKITLRDGLPFIEVMLIYRGRTLNLNHVVIDTGSAGSLFAADQVAALGISPDPQDTVYRIRGVGGAEFVFTGRVDGLAAGELEVRDFEIGVMNYGFEIESILGMAFACGHGL